MKREIRKYETIIFDCDGVILNSNKVKTSAFYQAAKEFGVKEAEALVEYHIANGGISRYKKLEYFITDIMGKSFDKELHKYLLERFSEEVTQSLLRCEIAQGLDDLKNHTPKSTWMVVSGGDQEELRKIFSIRGLDDYFSGGIYGSPDDKKIILSREIERGNIKTPALFIGDSKYDHTCSQEAEIDFVFLSFWTEVESWELWCLEKNIEHEKQIVNLIK